MVCILFQLCTGFQHGVSKSPSWVVCTTETFSVQNALCVRYKTLLLMYWWHRTRHKIKELEPLIDVVHMYHSVLVALFMHTRGWGSWAHQKNWHPEIGFYRVLHNSVNTLNFILNLMSCEYSHNQTRIPFSTLSSLNRRNYLILIKSLQSCWLTG